MSMLGDPRSWASSGRCIDFCALDRNGIYLIPSLCAKTAVGVFVIPGFSPGILIALRLKGKSHAALNPEIMVLGIIALDQAAEKILENWYKVTIWPGLVDMNVSHS